MDPADLRMLFSRVARLLESERCVEAHDLCRRACATDPGNPLLWRLLGKIGGHCRRYREAEESLNRALTIAPSDPQSWYLLGGVLQMQRRFPAAAEAYRKTLQLRPDHREAGEALGYVLQVVGDLEGAAAAYESLLELDPDQGPALYNLGLICSTRRRCGEAAGYFRAALRVLPDNAEVYNSLGFVLRRTGDSADAEACLRQALQYRPDFAEAHYNLGMVLMGRLAFSRAERHFRKAAEYRGGFADAIRSAGNALLAQGLVEEAESRYRKVVAIDGSHVSAHSNLLMTLHYREHQGSEAVYREHLLWADRHGRPIAGAPEFTNDRDPDRRLRVGYVSPDFRTHSVTYFFRALLESRDPGEVEVFCYSGVEQPDATTAELKGLADGWRSTVGQTDEGLCDTVRTDAIDILVDLAGHTGGSRLRALRRKPAPVLVTYLGYPNTTGLPSIDYRFTDLWADPPGDEGRYTEELVRLPGGFLCYSPDHRCPAVSDPPFLSGGHIVFGSFNNAAKLSPELLETWATILKEIPDSRLLLKSKAFIEESVRNRYIRTLVGFGVDNSRVDLIPWSLTPEQHMMQYARVDIALDTFPYTGTTTSCEALWMGVPVITLRGSRHAGRVGASLLESLGMPELVAGSREEYVSLATGLANDPGRIVELRGGLRQYMAAAALCDAGRLCREVEAAFRAMWRRWCES